MPALICPECGHRIFARGQRHLMPSSCPRCIVHSRQQVTMQQPSRPIERPPLWSKLSTDEGRETR